VNGIRFRARVADASRRRNESHFASSVSVRARSRLPSVRRSSSGGVRRAVPRRVASGGRDEIDDDIRVGSREVVNAERRNVVWVFSVKAVRKWRRSRGKDGKVDARVATKSANGVV